LRGGEDAIRLKCPKNITVALKKEKKSAPKKITENLE